MPDWQTLVSQRLAHLALEERDREEVFAELAGHLEESYESLLRQGDSEHEAIPRVLSQVANWQDLQRKIYSARTKENNLTPRVSRLWLPGLFTFAISMGLLSVAQKFGPPPLILNLDHPPVLMFYTRWLLMLPLAGSVGAYLSKRAGGALRVALLSSMFPVLPFAAVFLVAIPVGLLIDHSIAHSIVAAAFLNLMLGWVFAPGAALLAGNLLVQLAFLRRSASGRVVAS